MEKTKQATKKVRIERVHALYLDIFQEKKDAENAIKDADAETESFLRGRINGCDLAMMATVRQFPELLDRLVRTL